MEYISDVITEKEFMNWGPGQRVFITAATGMGKSYFILYELLLKRVVRKKEKILYLVNRKILKEQLEEELDNDVFDKICENIGDIGIRKDFIEVETYQRIEERIQGNLVDLLNFLRKFHIIVYDECHYFYSDSNFNTYTEISYDCLRRFCNKEKKIQIFISATMENVGSCMDAYDKRYCFNGFGPIDLLEMNIGQSVSPGGKKEDLYIDMPQDYSYLNINSFNGDENLIGIVSKNVKEKNEKWIIFVDSIEKGNKLKNKLINETSEGDVSFIDASFENDEDSSKTVNEINRFKKFKNKKILLATSVMYNGVSICDVEVRNIVILYDTKEEFIQMLGRKRRDGKDVSLYICKRDRNHFRLRLQKINKIYDFYKKHGENINKMYQRKIFNPVCSNIDKCDKERDQSYTNNCGNFRLIACPNYGQNICPNNCQKQCKCKIDFTPYFDLYNLTYSQTYIGDTIFDYKEMYRLEIYKMLYLQQEILKDALKDKENNQIMYALNGFIAINYFSVRKIINLHEFYSEMEQKLINDEDAFLKEQMSWLNLRDDEIEENIRGMNQNEDDEYKEFLENEIKGILNKKLNKEEIIKWKNKVRKALVHFLSKSEETKKEKKDVEKNDRPSYNGFNVCMDIAGLNYMMKTEDDKYIICEKK